MTTEYYCPACGNYHIAPTQEPITISPGDLDFTCPNCRTSFTITIEFWQKTDWTFDTEQGVKERDWSKLDELGRALDE